VCAPAIRACPQELRADFIASFTVRCGTPSGRRRPDRGVHRPPARATAGSTVPGAAAARCTGAATRRAAAAAAAGIFVPRPTSSASMRIRLETAVPSRISRKRNSSSRTAPGSRSAPSSTTSVSPAGPQSLRAEPNSVRTAEQLAGSPQPRLRVHSTGFRRLSTRREALAGSVSDRHRLRH
jgi:hypothetical protein